MTLFFAALARGTANGQKKKRERQKTNERRRRLQNFQIQIALLRLLSVIDKLITQFHNQNKCSGVYQALCEITAPIFPLD